MQLKALVLIAAAVLVGGAACGDGGPGSGGEIRTVLMDYKHDEVVTSMLAYFPKNVTVHGGDTVRFKQAWTGEPHSVTMGTSVDAYVPVLLDAIEKYPREEDAPPELVAQVEELEKGLPGIFVDEEGPIRAAQNGAQPCYLEEGRPPEDVDTSCPQREQPRFTGKQTFYSSGFVPYEGPRGNVFDVPLSEDIAPGTYFYYCNVHWIEMSGTVEVVSDAKEIPSQAEVSAQARKEIEKAAAPLIAGTKEAKAKASRDQLSAGVALAEDAYVVPSIVNEFVPADTDVNVGGKVTWKNSGGHSVSFNVPEYFPIITVADDGKVTANPDAYEPVKWPGQPDPPAGEGEEGPPGEGDDGAPGAKIDAGDFDGSGGLHSSGLLEENTEFTVRFTKKGTFNYACLVHPQMVGKVIVK